MKVNSGITAGMSPCKWQENNAWRWCQLAQFRLERINERGGWSGTLSFASLIPLTCSGGRKVMGRVAGWRTQGWIAQLQLPAPPQRRPRCHQHPLHHETSAQPRPKLSPSYDRPKAPKTDKSKQAAMDFSSPRAGQAAARSRGAATLSGKAALTGSRNVVFWEKTKRSEALCSARGAKANAHH